MPAKNGVDDAGNKAGKQVSYQLHYDQRKGGAVAAVIFTALVQTDQGQDTGNQQGSRSKDPDDGKEDRHYGDEFHRFGLLHRFQACRSIRISHDT